MRTWFFLALLCTLPLPNGLAETPEEKGLAIAREADRLDTGWVDHSADLEMILSNKRGQESTRALRITTKEVKGDGDKSLTIFGTPRDIKGTAFLSYTHALKPDDQWLYLPALKRVKRIASANKSGPFVGSEFAYEDLTSQEVAKYQYKWLRDEPYNGRQAFVVEQYPAYEHSGYTRRVVWIDQAIYQPLKIDFFDRKDALLKTLTFLDYQLYLDRYWRPDRMDMVNHLTGKRTVLLWKNYRFRRGLSDRAFDRNSLKRAR